MNAPTGFKMCPPGRFTFVMQETKVFESKQSQELLMGINWVVAKGEHKGETVYDGFSLENEDRFPFLKQRIEDLGYQVPDNRADIEEMAADWNREPPVIIADVINNPGKGGKVYANLQNVMLIEDKDLAAEAAAESEESEEEDAPEPEPETDEDADDAADEGGAIEVGSRVTFSDEDGDEYSGEVTKVDDDAETAKIKDDDGGVWDVDMSGLTLDETEPEDDTEDEQKTALVTIADAHDVEVDSDEDVDDIVKVMKKKTWKAKELAEDEIAALKEAGIPVVKTVAKKAVKKTAKKAAKKKGAKTKGAKRR